MANTLLTHDMLVDKLAFNLKNQLTFGSRVYTGYSDEYHAVGGFKKGATVRIPLPNKYRTSTGPAGVATDTYETNTTVTVDNHEYVMLTFTANDMWAKLERMDRKHLMPAAIALANKVDYDGLAETLNIYNLVGTAGTTPSTFAFLTAAAQRMDEEAVPRDGRLSVLSPAAHWSMADGELKAVFQQNVVDTLLRKGFIGTFALFDFFMDQNIRNHTSGTGDAKCNGSTVQVKTQPSEGATTLALKGFAAGETLTAGTVFTISTVAGVNPVSGAAWEGNTLRQFVVTALGTADGGGDMTVSVSPTIYSSAATAQYLPYQTVNDIPAVNDYITTYSATNSTAYPQNIFFHPEAFALTMLPFQKPESAGQSVKWAQSTDEDIGISITLTSFWDGTNYQESHRADILYGWDTIRPELAVRGTG